MKIKNIFTGVMFLGVAAWSGSQVAATTESTSADRSPQWQEAASAFKPVNELRTGDSETSSAQDNGTTMRWLGAGRGNDLTVFPPLKSNVVESSPSAIANPSTPTTVQQSIQVAEPQVVGMKVQPNANARQRTSAKRPVQSSHNDGHAELVLLPAVDAAERVAYAFADEAEAIEPVPSSESGTVIHESGPVTWGPPVYGASCDGGCCGPTCAPCRRRPIIVVSTEAVFLGTEINGSRVSYRFDEFNAAPPVVHQFGPAFGDAELDDFYMVPRISLGVQGECWGIVGRYFHMRAGEHDQDMYDPPAGPPIGIANQGFEANSLFEAYYTDLELTRNFCLHGSKNQFTFGARYALVQHDESVVGMSNVPEGILNGGARAQRQAHGTGITFGLNGRKPLFCNSCAHWFYSVRSSVLWGCTHNNVETWAEAIGAPVLNAGTKDGALVAVNDDLFIGEVQLGLEWDFALRCLPAKSFFRIAGEYQYWDASSGFAAAGSLAGFGNPGATSQITTSAQAPGLLVDLYGLSVATGFTW